MKSIMKKCICGAVLCLLTCVLFNPFRVSAASKAPATPKISISGEDDGTTVKITIAKTENADGYRIYFKAYDDAKYTKIKVKGNGEKERIYKKGGLDYGKYCVYVKAYRKINGTTYWSKASEELTIDLLAMKSSLQISDGVILEFEDGSRTTWKSGDKAIDTKGKKLAYIYFGNYPQTQVKGGNLTDDIKNAYYGTKMWATVNGEKYAIAEKSLMYYEGYYVFKFEPIKWRVLSVKDGKAFLLSEYGLDRQEYDTNLSSYILYTGNGTTTWEESTIRSWLNDYFISMAFTETEKKLIKQASIKNKSNPTYGTDGGEKTKDKIFLLSINDVTNKKLGFSTDLNLADNERECAVTAYASCRGAKAAGNDNADELPIGTWLLRSPGYKGGYAAYIEPDGSINQSGYYGNRCDTKNNPAIRPALYLELTKILKQK